MTDYKNESGYDHTANPKNALKDEEFLIYFIKTINKISSTMEYMTNGIYNDASGVAGETETANTRHTPKSEQELMLHIDLVNSLKTNINSKAFNMDQVAIDIPFKKIPFWQSMKSPDAINVKPASGGNAINQVGVMGVIFDREAMGTFKKKYTSLTSPINAAGKYYNVFYHMITMYFNDLTENAVIFLLD